MPANALRLHSQDDVAVLLSAVHAGTPIQLSGTLLPPLLASETIQTGHKVALHSIAAGAIIRKFGQPIGTALAEIHAGDHVHTHNLSPEHITAEIEFSTDCRIPAPPSSPQFFQGIRRGNRWGTRNFIAVLSTVNCSATTARYVARALADTDLRDYPNIDGIIPLVHKHGCAMDFDGSDHRMLNRTLAGFAEHPNIGGAVILGLGCETAQANFLVDQELVPLRGIPGSKHDFPVPPVLNIQEVGGVRKTVDRAAGLLRERLPEINSIQREQAPLSELIVGLECGGSDAHSGITANPALGLAVDQLVAHGGTAILSEVPEIYGAEHLLTRRSRSREVGEKLLERIRWWEDYAQRHNAAINNNPSVGNKRGGLSTILEKSLGAIAKGGSSPLNDVVEYAEPVREKGLVVMDTPGYDPASVTGMVAGGAQMIVFTTGRGSCFGCKPSPTIKVATNTPMARRMAEDMDINAGEILNGRPPEEVGQEIFDRIIAVAGGQKTLSEAQGIGDEEFCPWTPGPIF